MSGEAKVFQWIDGLQHPPRDDILVDVEGLLHKRKVEADAVEGTQAVCLVKIFDHLLYEGSSRRVLRAQDSEIVALLFGSRKVFRANHSHLIARRV